MPGTIFLQKTRHIRHRKFKGLVRGQEGAVKDVPRLLKLFDYLGARVTVLGATGTGQVFTADFANNELDIVGHGYVDGDGPFLATTDTTLPDGILADTLYWINEVTAGSLTLHLSREDAFNGTNIVPFVDAGAGVHTLTPAANSDALVELQRQNGIAFEQIRDETDIDNLIP